MPQVAPHTGAWIETFVDFYNAQGGGVAPHTGAWIETPIMEAKNRLQTASPPIRGRGLKPSSQLKLREYQKVAPHTGAWIETCAGSELSSGM